MAKDNFPALPDVPAALAEVPAGTLRGLTDRTAFAMSKSTPKLSSAWPDGVKFPLSELGATGGSEHPS